MSTTTGMTFNPCSSTSPEMPLFLIFLIMPTSQQALAGKCLMHIRPVQAHVWQLDTQKPSLSQCREPRTHASCILVLCQVHRGRCSYLQEDPGGWKGRIISEGWVDTDWPNMPGIKDVQNKRKQRDHCFVTVV